MKPSGHTWALGATLLATLGTQLVLLGWNWCCGTSGANLVSLVLQLVAPLWLAILISCLIVATMYLASCVLVRRHGHARVAGIVVLLVVAVGCVVHYIYLLSSFALDEYWEVSKVQAITLGVLLAAWL